MSSVYMRFVDEMLKRDAVTQDAALMGCLRRTTERVHGLASEVVGPEEGGEVSELVMLEGRDDGNGEGSGSGDGDRDADGDADGNMDGDMIMVGDSPPTSGRLQLVQPGQQLQLQLQQPSTTPPDNPPDAANSFFDPRTIDHLPIALPLSLPPQIYGNGWTFRPHPLPYPPSFNRLPDAAAMPLAPDSFAFRLTKAAMTFSYLLLSHSADSPIPLSEESRVFKSTLRYRTREDLLVRMRWILGPGIRELWRVADMPYGKWGDVIISRDDLQTGAGDTQPAAAVNDSDLVHETSRFMSVAGVEKHLIALGAKILDSETLELNIASSFSEPSSANDSLATQPDSWSFINFFSSNKRAAETTALNIKVSITRLVNSLSRNGVCLMRGPGFSRLDLGRAIEASIITATGGEIVA